MNRKLAAAAALVASLAAGGVYLYPEEMKLLASDPEPHQTVLLNDNELELLFNKPVDLGKSVVTVTDEAAYNVAKSLYMDKGVLVVRMKAKARSGYEHGNYNVRYYVTSTDGKVGKGGYAFHVFHHPH
jgi:methionine-rich copper-binding protein CopC